MAGSRQHARDHPRVCGEHAKAQVMYSLFDGSSPRMRGAPYPKTAVNTRMRIIPAYAGSTQRCPRRPPRSGDHPRVCGEHLVARCPVGAVVGSSPRMRGAHTVFEWGYNMLRIIPAYAGSTVSTSLGPMVCGDHPRVCGEH